MLGDGTIALSRWKLSDAPTASQQAAADRLAAATTASIRRFRDVKDAEASGYQQFDQYHWLNGALMADGVTLAPERPEGLMYVDDGGRKLLLGALFVAPAGRHGKQVGGPLTVWHYHDFADGTACLANGVLPIGAPDASGRCREGVPAKTSPEMLHVWIANPAGRFDPAMNVNSDLIEQVRDAEGS